MKEELYELANHIASAKGGLPQEWQDWAEEIEADIRKLANREAQPVAYLNKFSGVCMTLEQQPNAADDVAVYSPLYTAPPAPVVVKLPAEFYSGEGIVVRLEEVMAALAVVGVQFERKANVKTRCEFPAPAVPKEMTVEQAYENVQTWHYANGWNACRAAMLAQPVSSGYTVQDGWIPCSERMPELDKRVLLYFGSYDGHIEDGCIGDDGDGPYHYFFDGDSLQQEPTHWMPLPAAPEGGN
ncbi:Protein of uncharacterised function (DUF551) [Serratia marcescens]|uniref:DUF551 domain-containing protein n=1 Tax=Serratia marcescens TaxID=615 RepID=UPI000744E078|nr:DUF551 domain-containing protein [Serratia marcescens]CUY64064.1 Protein of uncharacterised function (DUF551) [Serratia marcescens]CUZ30241.1 Protein of uncharacterised function (DUF551) [Serratia marcescens]CUZ42590.1 Protein of uncharacterised function (DUF551) [Serratia marcescens]CVG81090.1 Protein of uncharacterised function (DUF551) [Serratia marcescens]